MKKQLSFSMYSKNQQTKKGASNQKFLQNTYGSINASNNRVYSQIKSLNGTQANNTGSVGLRN
jgi:hypothetical protein